MKDVKLTTRWRKIQEQSYIKKKMKFDNYKKKTFPSFDPGRVDL